ncbi:DUF998 domain-containing protein [Aurantiacibacter aquimixticola]|uniref:DUF998 domain-containing protein n=1 Tax=Aurantiacibacter aquimixticola TaxID=1958945 RepID=A0A419RR50_9SPHN|nr:DUF998 domain-containing protein [Aurantiacibacter aquimixticola]RJY08261.1 DUF998 domain-containing protein [Aurantiacibacter aquimixticola]
MEQTNADKRDDPLARVLGGIGLAGCLLVIVADLVGTLASDHVGIIRDTISDAAAGGRFDWLVDLGLYAFALAALAAAAGLWRWKADGWDWKLGQFTLLGLSIAVALVAGYEAYNRPEGLPDIHRYLVYALGALFPATVWLTSDGLADRRDWLKPTLRVLAVVWLIAGPFLYAIPTAWDGAYERVLATAMVAWFALVAWLIYTRPGEAD